MDPCFLTGLCWSYGLPAAGKCLIVYFVLTLSSSVYSSSYKSISYNHFSSNQVVILQKFWERLVLEFSYSSAYKQALGLGHCMHLSRVKFSKAILCPHILVSDCNVSYLSVCDLGSVDYFSLVEFR